MLAGLQQLRIGGDVLTAVDSTEITNQIDLGRILNRHASGQRHRYDLSRQKKQDVKVTLGDR